MSVSPARLAANRRNALKSTGPRSAEGKATARLNAWRHGLAGAGDLVAPGEDPGLVADRAAAFEAELGVTGGVGSTLAHRAAVLSVRLERASERERLVVAANIEAARIQFEEDRLDAVDRQIEALDGPDPRGAILALEESPEGLIHLIDRWRALQAAIGSGDPDAVAAAEACAALAIGADGPGDLNTRITTELHRLDQRLDAIGPTFRAIDEARDRAGILAGFDTSPAATLARRYEAAAERSMYRAIREIAQLRRLGASEEPQLEVKVAPPTPPPAPAAPPRPPATAPEPPTRLGSFRPAPYSDPLPTLADLDERAECAATRLAPPRKPRPDLRKLARGRR